jgi:ketosteroid isomerase-like protein
MTAPTLTPELFAFLEAQKDRQEIWQCLLRYTRGVDRHDRALMLSAYHPDAFDDHGVAEGIAGEFVDWALRWHAEYQTRHQHVITNHTVEIEGDTAHAETYYMFWGENREGPATVAFGRYVDRFEKRDGRWAIAHRVCVNELAANLEKASMSKEWLEKLYSTGPNRRDATDVSYLRPLTRAL